MTTGCILPAELIYQILCYMSPGDVVRLRAVSKSFCAISRDPGLWKALYENSDFIRPPGPPSNASSERALVQSARLAKLWTTQPLRRGPRIDIHFNGVAMCPVVLIGGRWFIVCQMHRRFVLYNTNATDTRVPQLLWEQEEEIVHWKQHRGTWEEGHWVVYLVVASQCAQRPPRWTILELQLDADSGTLCGITSLDTPALDFRDSVQYDGSQELVTHSRFLRLTDVLVFDKRTRMLFFEFSEFCLALDDTRSRVDGLEEMFSTGMLTKTHIINFHFYPSSVEEYHVVVQAFTTPDDQCPAANGKNVLGLSHEGIFESRGRGPSGVLQNSIVDPITGSINMRLLEQSSMVGYDLTCVDLTLHKPTPYQVSPITIERHAVIKSGNITPASNYLNHRFQFLDVSDNGYARGFCVCEYFDTRPASIKKFTIDATKDNCVAVLSEYSSVTWFDIFRPVKGQLGSMMVGSWDGVRGRFPYVCRGEESKDGHIVIVNLE